MSIKTKPNILIIYADQHRYDCIGAYGNKEIRTPGIDSLAQDGVLYENSFCPFPICTPSRYSFLTGLYVHQHCAANNHCTLSKNIPTFPRILKENGYKTKAIGKMHFTPTYLDVGFEEMELSEQHGPGRYDDDYHRYLKNKELVDSVDLLDQEEEYRKCAPEEYWDTYGALKSNLVEGDDSTSWIGRRALQTIETWGDGGNLLMVGFVKPHHPFDPPDPWSKMYNPEELSLLPGYLDKCMQSDIERHGGYFKHEELTEKLLKKVMSYYYACISQIDSYVGQLSDLLKQKGIYDNTVIIYSSDHGDYMGYHHLLLKMNSMYEPLVKVPLIIKYPGNYKKGEINEGLVSNIDIAPTVLGLAGCELAESMKGFDLVKHDSERKLVFAEYEGKEYMVRSNSRKLLYSMEEERSMFFDLDKDPLEMNNLYNNIEYRDEVLSYKDYLLRWRLFDTPAPAYLNEEEAIIKTPNSTRGDANSRKEMAEYYRNKMKDFIKV